MSQVLTTLLFVKKKKKTIQLLLKINILVVAIKHTLIFKVNIKINEKIITKWSRTHSNDHD